MIAAAIRMVLKYTFIVSSSGIISGMGIGGGTVLIPAMVVLAGTTQRVAQG